MEYIEMKKITRAAMAIEKFIKKENLAEVNTFYDNSKYYVHFFKGMLGTGMNIYSGQKQDVVMYYKQIQDDPNISKIAQAEATTILLYI